MSRYHPRCLSIYFAAFPSLSRPSSLKLTGSSFRSGPRGKDKGKKRDTSISKGRDLRGFEPMTKDSSWIELSDIDEDFPLTPSSKTTALKSLLLKGFEEAPLDKVRILKDSQILSLLEHMLMRQPGGCLRPVSHSSPYRRPYL